MLSTKTGQAHIVIDYQSRIVGVETYEVYLYLFRISIVCILDELENRHN